MVNAAAVAFLEGGWGMWVILTVGLVALVSAFVYARTGDARRRPFVEALGRAELFFTLSGFFTGFVATGGYIEAHPEAPLGATLLQGVKEASNTLAFGFTLLALIHLCLAVGQRREAARSVP
jgi:hypothetical protein